MESEKKKIVISQLWGGLGDNLQYSTLPRRYSELGYEVYVSYNNACRNREIFDLVWKCNPYIKGITEEPANAGACISTPIPNCTTSFIANIEMAHHLSHPYSRFPEIYYRPQIIEELRNTVLYDLTSVSANYPDHYLQRSISRLLEPYSDLDQKQIVFQQIENRISTTHSYMIRTIYEYCDAIASCKAFICLHSGGSVLAAAIKQDLPYPTIHCLLPRPIHYNSFLFDGIQYHSFEEFLS
jgi:hypothetical protein